MIRLPFSPNYVRFRKSESEQSAPKSIVVKKCKNTHHAGNFIEMKGFNPFNKLGIYYKWDCCGVSRLDGPFCQPGKPKHHKHKYKAMWSCCAETNRLAPGCVPGPGSAEGWVWKNVPKEFVDKPISDSLMIPMLDENCNLKLEDNLLTNKIDRTSETKDDLPMDTSICVDEDLKTSSEVLVFPEDAEELRQIIHSSSLLITSSDVNICNKNEVNVNTINSDDENHITYEGLRDKWVYETAFQPTSNLEKYDVRFYDGIICPECSIQNTDMNNNNVNTTASNGFILNKLENSFVSISSVNPLHILDTQVGVVDGDLSKEDSFSNSSSSGESDDMSMASSVEEYQPIIHQDSLESVMVDTYRSSSSATDDIEQVQRLQSMMIEFIRILSNDNVRNECSKKLQEINNPPLRSHQPRLAAKDLIINHELQRTSYIKSLKWDSCPQSMRDDWHWYTSAYKKHQLDQFEGKYVLIAKRKLIGNGLCFHKATEAAEYVEERKLSAVIIHVGPERESPSLCRAQTSTLHYRGEDVATWDKPTVSM